RLGGDEEQVKLIDFGIAKVLDSEAGQESEGAGFSRFQDFLAPEKGLLQTVFRAAGYFALTLFLLEKFDGDRIFTQIAPNHFLAMQQRLKLQQSQSIIKPIDYRPDLPEAAQILLLNALSYDVNRRPQNAQIFADDLARALTGEIKLEINGALTEILTTEPQR